MDSSYLVKKMVFPVGLLPIIKITSSLFVHLFFVVFMLIMFLLYGYGFSIYELQLIYYLIATIIFLLGLSAFTSSLMIFLKDVGQFVVMILQFAFWLTPIFWSPNNMPKKIQLIAKLNPMYYIVEGYRNSLIYHRWFWQDAHITIYFWVLSLALLVGGRIFLRKLQPHFADVL
jgi:ABC-type polysaccharide/polyol phosphate export permease